MKTSKLTIYLIGLVLGAFLVGAVAQDNPTLTFKFKKFTVPGGIDTNAGGISNSGVLVGQYTDNNLVLHGFILQGKKLTKLDDPNGTNTGASNLTLDGPIQVVGSYTNTKSGNPMGFLYKGGKFTDIPGPSGAIASGGNAINDAGDIAGFYVDSSGKYHGFLLKKGKYTTLDPPGATGALTQATGVNKKDQVVLYWYDSSNILHSSLWNGKTFKSIDVPGLAQSVATDINTAGDVTYQTIDSGGADHGALLFGGKYYKFDYPKSAFTFAGAVNDKRTIVGGWRQTSKGHNIGYTATF